jgi:hypothetical protein
MEGLCDGRLASLEPRRHGQDPYGKCVLRQERWYDAVDEATDRSFVFPNEEPLADLTVFRRRQEVAIPRPQDAENLSERGPLVRFANDVIHVRDLAPRRSDVWRVAFSGHDLAKLLQVTSEIVAQSGVTRIFLAVVKLPPVKREEVALDLEETRAVGGHKPKPGRRRSVEYLDSKRFRRRLPELLAHRNVRRTLLAARKVMSDMCAKRGDAKRVRNGRLELDRECYLANRRVIEVDKGRRGAF